MVPSTSETVLAQGSHPARGGMLPPVVLWTMRLLGACGLAVALFLTGIHIVAALKAARVQGPYCRILSFFDCDTVLNSEWATWFGVPVPVLGAGAYLVLLAGLLSPLHRSNAVRAGRVWMLLCITSAAIAGAAGWFIYLQLVALGGAICLWCMAEHAIGLTLFVLIWMHAFGAGALRGRSALAAIIVGLIPVAILMAGQHLDTHTYVKTIGPIELDAGQHLLLGRPTAVHIAVEAIDYTCPRCKRLATLIGPARQLLGPDYAFIVLTTPLHPDCNRYYAQDYGGEIEERHRHACTLAELAHAVRLADPRKFEEFHAWLFDQQEELREDPQLARAMAAQLVGAAALEQALAQVRERGLIERDIETAAKLQVGQLPGLFAGGVSFVAIPDQPDTLAQQIYDAFQGPR